MVVGDDQPRRRNEGTGAASDIHRARQQPSAALGIPKLIWSELQSLPRQPGRIDLQHLIWSPLAVVSECWSREQRDQN